MSQKKILAGFLAAGLMATMMVNSVYADDINIDTGGSATIRDPSSFTDNTAINNYVDNANSADPSSGAAAGHGKTYTVPQYIIDAQNAKASGTGMLKDMMDQMKNRGSSFSVNNGTDYVSSVIGDGKMDQNQFLNYAYEYMNALGEDYVNQQGLMDEYDMLCNLLGEPAAFNPDAQASGAAIVDTQKQNGSTGGAAMSGGLDETTYTGFDSEEEYPNADDYGLVQDEIMALLADNYKVGDGSTLTWFDPSGSQVTINGDCADGTSPISIIHGSNTANANGEVYTGIRDDLFHGGVQDTSSYAQRFAQLIRELASGRGNAALSDTMNVSYVMDYHITNFTKMEYQDTDYDDNTRIWGVYNAKTGQLMEEKQTNNPEHAFTFQGYPKGNYIVRCSAMATYRMNIAASYDLYEYLIDNNTGMILYWNRTTQPPVMIKSSIRRGRIPTGNEWTINVTDKELNDGKQSFIQRLK